MAGAFCPICYEVVDILSQNLESVAGCGHVFHESCLQQWVAHSPVSPQCPLCKASCGSRERQRLYFQTSADCTQQLQPAASCLTDTVYSEADLKYILKLEEKVRLLKKSLELSRQQSSDLQAAVEENKTKVLTISEIARLANQKQNLTEDKLRRAEQELDGSRKEKNRLMKEMAKLERDIRATKLVDNVDLSEDEVLDLTMAGAGRAQSNDEYIQVLAKALVTRNWAFKNLMTTCNEHCLEKDDAKREASKLRAKVEQLQARLKETVNAQEKSENATLRALSNVQTSDDFRPKISRSPAKSSVNRPSRVEEIEASEKLHTFRNRVRDELSRACLAEDCNRPDDVHAEREDAPIKYTLGLSPRATESCANAMDRIRTTYENNSDSTNVCKESSMTEGGMDETFSVDLDTLPIPIRRERKSSLVEDSFFSNDSVISWKETARSLAGSTNISSFHLSGPHGPSGRAVVKPPPSFIVPSSLRASSSSRQGKRPKVDAPQGLKIDHFFGRH